MENRNKGDRPDQTSQTGKTGMGMGTGTGTGTGTSRPGGSTFNPADEDSYWRQNYARRDYYEKDRPYTDYAPAYRYGWESYSRNSGKTYDENEMELSRGWERAKGDSKLAWEKAKHAVKDAWHRVERAIPGDADNDGR